MDAAGPGAWPAREWDAWQAQDRELNEKGSRAHAQGLLIAEEAGRLEVFDVTAVEQIEDAIGKHDGSLDRPAPFHRLEDGDQFSDGWMKGAHKRCVTEGLKTTRLLVNGSSMVSWY